MGSRRDETRLHSAFRPTLEGERVLLRDFARADLVPFQAYREDPRYLEYYEPAAAERDRSERLLEGFLAWSKERPRRNFQLAVVERSTEHLIGCCGLRTRGLPAGYAEYGIEISPESWGAGLAPEASRLVLEFGFRRLALAEVRGVSVTQNTRVARLANRLGFAALAPRSGERWMRARGWTLTDWVLTRSAWSTRFGGHGERESRPIP
jgi:ribosomal-protein-alanine N-acetyltransferase